MACTSTASDAAQRCVEERPSAEATALPSEVLPTPGGPTRHRIGPRVSRRREHGEMLVHPPFHLFEAVVLQIENVVRRLQIERILVILPHGIEAIQSR